MRMISMLYDYLDPDTKRKSTSRMLACVNGTDIVGVLIYGTDLIGDGTMTLQDAKEKLKTRDLDIGWYDLNTGKYLGEELPQGILGKKKDDYPDTKYNPYHQPAGSSIGGQFAPASGSSSGGGLTLQKQKERAYTGEPIPLKTRLTKRESGKLGEDLALAYLRHKGYHDSKALNMERENFPVDLIQDHELIEVKTGLVSNGKSAQHWRATIGQPGPKEREWLKTASPELKREWNLQKAADIMERKEKVLRDFSEKYNTKTKGKTIATIINPDKKVVDVYEFEGFHLRIGWNSIEAKGNYKGSFSYADAG